MNKLKRVINLIGKIVSWVVRPILSVAYRIFDKYNSLWRKIKYKEGKYFRTVQTNEYTTSLLQVEFLKKPYKGINVAYGAINIVEVSDYSGAKAEFDIEITNPDMSPDLKDVYLLDKKFTRACGQILLIILEQAVKMQYENFIRENLDEEIREDYFEEPVAKRTVSKKDTTVSKEGVSEGKKRKTPVRRNRKVLPEVQPPANTRSSSNRTRKSKRPV